MTWSPGDVDVGIQSLLIQFYPILLSTLLSINRHQLSRFEASFALLLSSSPLTMYLVAASIGDLFGIHTGLYKRIKSYRPIIRTLGALVLLIWNGLTMTFIMSESTFKDPECSAPRTFAYWVRFIVNYVISSITFLGGIYEVPRGVAWVITTPCFVCLARRWSQLRADVKLHSEGASRLRVFCTWVKCAWCVPVDVGSPVNQI